ncbi:hypothetical protein WJS89_10580 [Sphingomicrobium sp. XHP0235]|uniref:hypothetical protein n=1 Tax=Sphingomicrobium aquimarinum TaxID=3133971 RepID=UPI0031FE46EB
MKPTLGYNDGYTDFTPLLDHPETYRLLSDGEGFAVVLEQSEPGVWQAHTMALPEARGKSVQSARYMLEYMFADGANEIWGQTPIDHPAALKFNEKVGFNPGDEYEDAAGVMVRRFSLGRDEWTR